MSDERDHEDLVPTFPVEIERLIVDKVTEDTVFPLEPRSGATYLNIQLTAKRFRDWVMFTIFRYLDINTIRRYREAVGARFVEHLVPTYGKVTKHLNHSQQPVHNDTRTFIQLLEYFPNLEDLTLWNMFSQDEMRCVHSSIQSCSQLQRFACYGWHEEMLREEASSGGIIYRNVTHLDLGDPMPFALLAQFHNIIHLSVSENGDDWASLLTMLHHHKETSCRSLRFITGTEVSTPKPTFVDSDDRFVQLCLSSRYKNFWFGENGGIDFWEFSKRIVVARKRGYMLNAQNRSYHIQEFKVETEFNEQGQTWWRQLDGLRTAAKGYEWWSQPERDGRSSK